MLRYYIVQEDNYQNRDKYNAVRHARSVADKQGIETHVLHTYVEDNTAVDGVTVVRPESREDYAAKDKAKNKAEREPIVQAMLMRRLKDQDLAQLDGSVAQVIWLWAEGESRAEIARRTGMSAQKVRRVLLDVDLITAKETRLYREGMSFDEIAATVGKKSKTINNYAPYTKGVYKRAEPTINALRVRATRAKQKQQEEQNEQDQHTGQDQVEHREL